MNPQATTWFLNAHANTLQPTLDKSAKTSYRYDPAHPTPHLIDVSANELEFPNDYAQVEQRPDVVSFTSEPVKTALTITGWFQVTFFASSTAVDTDWVVRLTDVTPTGQSLNIAEGVLNAKFRESPRKPQLLVPGEVYRFTVETQKTSIRLPQGHRLRLDIASAADNLIFPNSNTAQGAQTTDGIPATQTIYTGPDHPSALRFNLE